MWNMETGIRVLTGSDAELFRLGLEALVMELETWPNEPAQIGVATFDRLSWGQQVTVIHEVGRGVLLEHIEPVRLNAANESAIAAIYYWIADVLPEDHFHNGPFARCALEAAALRDPEIFGKFADRVAENALEWAFLTECLRDEILWDSDYDDMGLSDLEPSAAHEIQRSMSIDEQYYTTIIDDPSEDRGLSLLADLRQECKL